MESMTIQANEKKNKREPLLIDLNKLTDGEKVEMKKLGLLSEKNDFLSIFIKKIKVLDLIQ